MRFASLTVILVLGIACDPPGNAVPEFSFYGLPAVGCIDPEHESCNGGAPWVQHASRNSLSKLYAWPANRFQTPGPGSEGVCDPAIEAFSPSDEQTWPSLSFEVQLNDADRDDLQVELWLRAVHGETHADTEQLLCHTTVYGEGVSRLEPFEHLQTNDCSLYLGVNARQSVRAELEQLLGTPLRVNSDPREERAATDPAIQEANSTLVNVASLEDSRVLQFVNVPMPCEPGSSSDFCITAHDSLADANTDPTRVYELELRVADKRWDSAQHPAVQDQDDKRARFHIYTFDPRYSWPATITSSSPTVPTDQQVQVTLGAQAVVPALPEASFRYVACRTPATAGNHQVVSGSVEPHHAGGADISLFEAGEATAGDTILLKSATCWAPDLRKANGESEPPTSYCTPITVTTAQVEALEEQEGNL